MRSGARERYVTPDTRLTPKFYLSFFFDSDAENAVLTTYPTCDDCEVGLGWYSAMNSVRDLVIEAVEGLSEEYEGAGIILTGHSLGGEKLSMSCDGRKRQN